VSALKGSGAGAVLCGVRPSRVFTRIRLIVVRLNSVCATQATYLATLIYPIALQNRCRFGLRLIPTTERTIDTARVFIAGLNQCGNK